MSARGRVPCGGVSGRTHRSAPTRWGKISVAHKTILCESLCHGAGQSPPPTGGTGAGWCVRRRGAPGVWLPPAKFRFGIWGVSQGHPALRVQRWWCAAAGRCGHRPLRIEGEAVSTTRASGAQRSVCGAVARDGWKLRQRSPQKGSSTPDNPSVGLWPTAPFAQGSLWGRGMRIAVSARWASSQ